MIKIRNSIKSHFKSKSKSCFSIFYILYTVDTVYQNVLCNTGCLYIMELKKQKNILCTREASLCLTQKNNFCIMNKIKLVWFYSIYKNYFFELKYDLFVYFKNIFYYVTLENIFRILNNYVCFQNTVICNEPFMLYFINWPNFITWLHLLLEILVNSVLQLFVSQHVTKWPIVTKYSSQKFKYLENKASL